MTESHHGLAGKAKQAGENPIGKEDGGIPIVTSEPDGRSEARASRPLKVEALLQILTH
jgi:hypothetical protein